MTRMRVHPRPPPPPARAELAPGEPPARCAQRMRAPGGGGVRGALTAARAGRDTEFKVGDRALL